MGKQRNEDHGENNENNSSHFFNKYVRDFGVDHKRIYASILAHFNKPLANTLMNKCNKDVCRTLRLYTV